jgi:mRNA-capping enzyme
MAKRDNGPGPIPSRWLNCPRKSEGLIGARFLAFKTPLSSKFHDQMPMQCQFEPEMIFDLLKKFNVSTYFFLKLSLFIIEYTFQSKMGLWIDLTNTNRFYDRRDIENFDCKYVKLKCKGHGETPTQEQVESFIELVDDFVSANPLQIIGIHCTHGFNRTGFLITSYLVQREDYSVEAAIMEFAKARPPGIYKADYIAELFARYEPDEEPFPAPELPDWCFENDEGEEAGNRQEIPDQDDNPDGEEDGDDERYSENWILFVLKITIMRSYLSVNLENRRENGGEKRSRKTHNSWWVLMGSSRLQISPD